MTGYVTLTRQSGLMTEMQVVAQNIANLSTTGYRREGVVFSEFVHGLDAEGGSVSMAAARVRMMDTTQGTLTQTNATFDFAIEGPGYFMVEIPEGQGLTRSGTFTPNAAGELVTVDGHRLLDAGGAPVFVPPDAASIRLAPDGTLSTNGQPLSQIGLFEAERIEWLNRRSGALFVSDGAVTPVDDGRILQGFLEASNVDPVLEIARMIEIQRAYEFGARFLEQEGQRKRSVMQTLGR